MNHHKINTLLQNISSRQQQELLNLTENFIPEVLKSCSVWLSSEHGESIKIFLTVKYNKV